MLAGYGSAAGKCGGKVARRACRPIAFSRARRPSLQSARTSVSNRRGSRWRLLARASGCTWRQQRGLTSSRSGDYPIPCASCWLGVTIFSNPGAALASTSALPPRRATSAEEQAIKYAGGRQRSSADCCLVAVTAVNTRQRPPSQEERRQWISSPLHLREAVAQRSDQPVWLLLVSAPSIGGVS